MLLLAEAFSESCDFLSCKENTKWSWNETEKFQGICEDNVKTKKRIGKRILLREAFDYVSKNNALKFYLEQVYLF